MQKAFTKTKILPKAEKINFQYFLNLSLNRKKHSPQPKILPKAEKSIFQYFFN